MVTFVVYLIFFYWIASFFFFSKSKHYYFQRYLYIFLLQSIILIFFIESCGWESLFIMHLRTGWVIFLFIFICLYVCQAIISLLKMFPDIFTLEWWEAFHRYNIYNFFRAVSNKKEFSISNVDWLTNQNSCFLYNFIRAVKIIKFVTKFIYYIFFVYLLKNCWYIEPEVVWFQVDYFIFIYWRFFVLVPFVFLLIHSIFFKNVCIRYYLLILNVKVESKMLDRAYFDPNFGFSLSVENAEEYMRYSYQVLSLITDWSHKRSADGTHEVDLSETTEITRLIWNDAWWDCNSYYYSYVYIKYKYKYKNK